MRYRTHFIHIGLLLFSLFFLFGCGKKPSSNEREIEVSEGIDWKNKGFIVSGDVAETQGLWIKEYIPWKTSNERIGDDTLQNLVDEVGIYNGKIYRFVSEDSENVSGQVEGFVLKIYDIKSGESGFVEFPEEQTDVFRQYPKDSRHAAIPLRMKIIDDTHYALQWCEWEETEDGQYKICGQKVIYYKDGEVEQETDILESYLQNHILSGELENVLLFPRISAFYDARGNGFVLGDEVQNEYTGIYVFHKDGSLLSQYKGEEYQKVQEPFRAESGEWIFPIYDSKQKSYSFWWLDLETKEWKKIVTFESSQMFRKVFGMQGNMVYYELPHGIVQWNVETGERNLAFSYRESGIPSDYRTMMDFPKGEAPILRLYSNRDGEDDWLATMSFEKVDSVDAVRIVDLVMSTNNAEIRLSAESATLLSRKDRTVSLVYEKPEGDWNDYRNQVFTELAAGSGPELLYVNLDDFEVLQKKGLLMDLREVISEDMLQEILPGALEIGTIDGTLLGVPFEVYVEGMVVSKDTWSKKTWTWDEYFGLMRQGKIERAIYIGSQGYFWPFASTMQLTQFFMNDPRVVDWNERKSYFNGKSFMEMLELLNVNHDDFEVDTETWFKEGKRVSLFTINQPKSLLNYITTVEKNNGIFVGLPTEEENGNYLAAAGVIVVNKNISDKEVARKYFRYLFSDEVQDSCGRDFRTKISVKKLDLERITPDTRLGGVWDQEGLPVFDDGTTSLQKAKEFLEKCVAMPRYDKQISSILREELPPYYEGQKTAKQVAEIVQSRVQLYLDEGN